MPSIWTRVIIAGSISFFILVTAFAMMSSRIISRRVQWVGSIYHTHVVEAWRSYESRRAFHKYEPRPPPNNKIRRLSEVQTLKQGTSMFLTKLPIEIRLIIYNLAIVGEERYWVRISKTASFEAESQGQFSMMMLNLIMDRLTSESLTAYNRVPQF